MSKLSLTRQFKLPDGEVVQSTTIFEVTEDDWDAQSKYIAGVTNLPLDFVRNAVQHALGYHGL